MELEHYILGEVLAGGGQLSPERLRRLSDAGLIGPKRQVHLPGLLGSATGYPDGTLSRVLVIGQLCKWKKRRFDWIGWRLWWNGYGVDERYWKHPLRRRAMWLSDVISAIRKLFDRHGGFSEQGYGKIERLRKGRTRQLLFLKLRRRVHVNDWPTAMRYILEIATGKFRGPKSENREIQDQVKDHISLEFALGLRRARRDKLNGVGPWLVEDIEEVLTALSRALGQWRPRDICELSDAQVEESRDEIRGVFEIVAATSDALEFPYGRNAFGLRALAQIAKYATPTTQALFVLFWPALKKLPRFQENLDAFLKQLPQARQLRENYQALTHVLMADEGLAKIIGPKRLKAAFIDAEKMAELKQLVINYLAGRIRI